MCEDVYLEDALFPSLSVEEPYDEREMDFDRDEVTEDEDMTEEEFAELEREIEREMAIQDSLDLSHR